MAHANSTDSHKLEEESQANFNEAANFLKMVKTRFLDEEQTYRTFLEILDMYRKGEKSVRRLLYEVKLVLKDHEDLVVGFSYFPPIPRPPEEGRIHEFEDAINYVTMVEMRFANDKEKYTEFLDILKMYRTGQKNINETFDEMSLLLWEHNDLINGFTSFAPAWFIASDGQQEGSITSSVGSCCTDWSLPVFS